MSDTPITDAAYDAVRAFTNEEQAVDALIELRDTSRKLERENAALRNEIVRLNNQTMWVCSCGGTDCAGRKENAALRADIHAHEQINKQLIEDKRRLDWLTDTGCWLTFPSLSKHPNWKYGTARDVIDLARKEAQP